MKFSIGDPVYIKTNNEEGKIEEFIGANMASVVVNNKNYHVFLEDLEHPYLRWFQKQAIEKKKKTPYIDQLSVEKFPVRKAALPQGIYLVCMPVYQLEGFDEVVEKYKLFIYNETLSSYKFEMVCKVNGKTIFTLDSELRKESEFYLHDIEFEVMASSPNFWYRFIDSNNEELDNEDNLIVKPKKLFEKTDENKYVNNAFFHFLLFEKITVRVKQEVILKHSISSFKKEETKRHLFDFEEALKKSTHVIDLHIEKLIPTYKGLSPSEIILIQLKECQSALDLAIATRQLSIVIIHGIGKGVLKNEINNLLNQTKCVKSYVNEYDVKYGYGATKVFFQY